MTYGDLSVTGDAAQVAGAFFLLSSLQELIFIGLLLALLVDIVPARSVFIQNVY